MEMASSEVEISSCQTFNCVMSPHNNKKKKNNNNNNVRNIHVAFEKNLNVFVRDHLENCIISGDNGDDSTKSVHECSSSNKSSVSSDHRLSKTEESQVQSSSSSLGSDPDPNFSNPGQPVNPSRNEKRAASSLVQIWERRTTQQPNQNQSQIDSRTSSSGSSLLENSESLNEESVKESELIQPIEEDVECDLQFVPPLQDSGEKEKEKEGVRVMDIIRKLSNDSEMASNNDNGSSSYESSKEVQTTEARCFPQVTCSPRIRGRQAFADLLVQMMRDREKELACLFDRHSVSKFTHRGRIQSTLRIRCYERCIAIQDRHRCKPSSGGSDLNRSPRVNLLRSGKYKTNSESIETGAASSPVSSRGRVLDKDPHNKVAEKKVLQETLVNSATEIVKKAVLSDSLETKSGLNKSAGETIQKETSEGRGQKRQTKEKAVAKESLEGRGEKRESMKEKAIIAKESVEGNALIGIAEKVNLWNSEDKMNRRKGMERGKIEGKGNNTERVDKNDVMEEATRRIINVENVERSISTTSREDNCVRKPDGDKNVLQEKTANSETNKPIEKENGGGKGGMREMEESEEGNRMMGIAEKVNLWNSKEKKNRRRVIEKGKSKTEGKANTEIDEVLQEASRRIINVETAERSIAISMETIEKAVGNKKVMDRRESNGEATRCESEEKGKSKKEEAKSKEIIEDKNINRQEFASHGSNERNKQKNSSQEMLIVRNSEAKFTKEVDRSNSQDVTQEEESASGGARDKSKEKISLQEMSILPNQNDENSIQESEDEETKKVEREEKEESVNETAIEFVNDWDENEMEEEQEENEYGDYDQYNGENMSDWIYDISRPRSYWEDLRKERYLEVLNTESENKDICKLIESRTVSNFLTSDLRKKIDNLMISRVQSHFCVPNIQEEEEEEEGGEEEWGDACLTRNQEDNETEEEPEKTNLEAASDGCSQSSSWSFRDQDIFKDHEPTTSLYLAKPSVPTNQSTQEMQMICDLRGQMEQLQREMLELRNTVKSCMDVQLHFQKSVTQDLSRSGSSAEQRVETKKDPLKRKCCVCSEMPVDSLLYRCGHMCTCLKCAHELQWSSKKCPICMAPIVDVVRAFLDS